jgi:hypothetical protein
MLRFTVRSAMAVALMLGATEVIASQPAAAQSVKPSAPPVVASASRATVSGILVARPGGRAMPIPPMCRTQSQAAAASTLQNRGLVLCSDAGQLVLLQLSPETGIYARYWGKRALRFLREGDHLNAWGTPQSGGLVLDPTIAVQDTDMQEAFTDSQDLITQGGRKLTLAVLASTRGGPVEGMVHAIPGGPVHITLCGGVAGTWQDLTAGGRIAITNGLFNSRVMNYVRVADVQVIGCR